MSINTLLSNPPILAELAAALGAEGTIKDVVSADGNLTFSSVGSTLDISFASPINVSGASLGAAQATSLSTGTLAVTSFKNPWTASPPASNGQVLSSTTSGTLSWSTVTGEQTLVSADGNLTFSGSGTGPSIDISFANTIDVSGLRVTNFDNPWTLSQPTVEGQFLSSTMGGGLSWETVVASLRSTCSWESGTTITPGAVVSYDRSGPMCFLSFQETPLDISGGPPSEIVMLTPIPSEFMGSALIIDWMAPITLLDTSSGVGIPCKAVYQTSGDQKLHITKNDLTTFTSNVTIPAVSLSYSTTNTV